VARLYTFIKVQPVSTGFPDIVFSALNMKNLPLTSGVDKIDNQDYCVSHLVLIHEKNSIETKMALRGTLGLSRAGQVGPS
jgi:hypothetical protein